MTLVLCELEFNQEPKGELAFSPKLGNPNRLEFNWCLANYAHPHFRETDPVCPATLSLHDPQKHAIGPFDPPGTPLTPV